MRDGGGHGDCVIPECSGAVVDLYVVTVRSALDQVQLSAARREIAEENCSAVFVAEVHDVNNVSCGTLGRRLVLHW